MGSGETREHHALTGVTPNIAARLEQHAPTNGVVISAQTRALVEASFHLRSLGRKDLKGVRDPVEVFEVTGRASAATVLRRTESPLIGRDAELDTLLGLWRRASSGRTVRASVTAEPGAGNRRSPPRSSRDQAPRGSSRWPGPRRAATLPSTP